MKSPRSLVSIEEASRVAFHERHSRSSVKRNLAFLRDLVVQDEQFCGQLGPKYHRRNRASRLTQN
ncbi:hypothetical protein HMPREF0972_01674 [Actinomyces sp. oral taxon 848 str. F0332]|nr:hypothetical protein HMPREF0972_01674 [Actinomyces sp. oral taxon 848 str. F0332]